ncbi:MAG: hypothetical protein JWR19_3135 [Pedosphaera sp.]|nr:hypothetical protein [Pedosphaera sp.]
MGTKYEMFSVLSSAFRVGEMLSGLAARCANVVGALVDVSQGSSWLATLGWMTQPASGLGAGARVGGLLDFFRVRTGFVG